VESDALFPKLNNTSPNGKKMCADENIVRKIVYVKSEQCVIGFSAAAAAATSQSHDRATE